MTMTAWRRIGCLALCASMLAGCASSPGNRFYVLSATAPRGAAPAARVASLDNVRLSGVTDRPQLVVRTSAQTVELREYDRWAEPFDEMVTRVLRQDLATRAGAAASSPTSVRIVVVIDDFLPDDSGNVTLSGHWAVVTDATPTMPAPRRAFSLSGRYANGNLEQAAATMSDLLGQLADAISAGLPAS